MRKEKTERIKNRKRERLEQGERENEWLNGENRGNLREENGENREPDLVASR